MSINLTKGQKISLTKDNPSLKQVTVGLGWDTNKYSGGFDFDLDKFVAQHKVENKSIAVAFDKAFNFYYRENIELLEKLGLEIK